MQLRPMSQAEFDVFRANSLENYAASIAKANGIPMSLARDRSEASFHRLLPQGRESPNQYLFICEWEGQKRGHLWYGRDDNSSAWIYDIEVFEEFRGQGFGRKILHAFEEDARSRGFTRLGLHVFSYNENALKLYESFGFESTGIVMKKVLV